MTENVYVEIVEDNQICITSKHNRVMPFVRYKVGDRGRLCTDKNCSCGSQEPILELEMAKILIVEDEKQIYKEIF